MDGYLPTCSRKYPSSSIPCRPWVQKQLLCTYQVRTYTHMQLFPAPRSFNPAYLVPCPQYWDAHKKREGENSFCCSDMVRSTEKRTCRCVFFSLLFVRSSSQKVAGFSVLEPVLHLRSVHASFLCILNDPLFPYPNSRSGNSLRMRPQPLFG